MSLETCSVNNKIGNKNYQKLHQFVTSLNFTEMHGTKNIKLPIICTGSFEKKEEFYTKHAIILTLLKPQTYAAVTAVNVTPEL
jgi:hypothetical protein